MKKKFDLSVKQLAQRIVDVMLMSGLDLGLSKE